jgi:CheY-like chemotaxis protein
MKMKPEEFDEFLKEFEEKEAKPVILAVDDKAIYLRLIQSALEKDFNLRIALSAAKALSIITTNSAKKKIDLILMDIEMPGMSGFDFMKTLKIVLPPEEHPPVIFVTANADPELIAQAKLAGVADYVMKPFDPDILRKKVKDVLGITETGETAPPPPTGQQKKKSILAIDDRSENLRILNSILENEYNVRLAKSGELAMSILNSILIDLILLDIEMPGMSGFEYMEWLKKNPATRHIPVIFVSSHAQPEIVQQATQYDIAGYIKKPVDPKLLREKIHEVFSKK